MQPGLRSTDGKGRGWGIKNQERRGGPTALMGTVASDSTPASDIVFGCRAFGGHDSEIGMPADGFQGQERGSRKGGWCSGRRGKRERGKEETRFYPN